MFYEKSLPLAFDINQSEVVAGGNVLTRFLEAAAPLLSGTDIWNARIRVRSSASPEGPVANNVRLSRERRNTLLKIFERYGIPASRVDVDAVDEDYEMLAFLMRKEQDPDAAVVSNYIRLFGTHPEELKNRLQTYNNGLLWRRMTELYFPRLRTSRFAVLLPRNTQTQQLEQVLAAYNESHTTPLPQTQQVVQAQPEPQQPQQVQQPQVAAQGQSSIPNGITYMPNQYMYEGAPVVLVVVPWSQIDKLPVLIQALQRNPQMSNVALDALFQSGSQMVNPVMQGSAVTGFVDPSVIQKAPVSTSPSETPATTTAEQSEETENVSDVLEPEPQSSDSVVVDELFDNVWNGTSAPVVEEEDSTPLYTPLLALKTNLLLDAAYVPQYGMCPLPNLGIEYFPRKGYWTLGASLDIPWWKSEPENKYFQARNWQVEVRRYLFCPSSEFRRLYLQGYAHVCRYSISFNRNKAWEGEGAGGGVGIGYVWDLGRRWRLEVGAQAGMFVSKYDPYVYGDPIDHVDNGYYYFDWEGRADEFQLRQYRYTWIGPTRVGITITYNLFLRQWQKGDIR